MIERSDGGYYPSIVVNMTIRFDEALQVAESPDGLSKAIATGEIGLRPEALARRQQITERAVGGVVPETYVQTSGGPVIRRAAPSRVVATRQFGPQVRMGDITATRYDADGNLVTTSITTDREVDLDGSARSLSPLTFTGDEFTTVMNVVPRKASVEMPGPRQAATFALDFDYDTLPIDPRLIRAVGVEIHLGCVTAKDYGEGMSGATDADGRSPSILATRSGLVDPATGKPAPDGSTLLFYGTVDKWAVEMDDTGSRATLTGRSIVGILLDGKPPADALKRVDLERPIHRVIADLIATIPTDQRLSLDVMTNEAEWPGGKVPAPGIIDGVTNITIGAATGKPAAGGGGGATDRVSYWDLITNLCYLVGGVPYLEGSTIWIRPGRSVFEIIDNPGRTPFRDVRTAADGELGFRRLLIGRHVKTFKIERTFGGTPVPMVHAVGFDDRATGKDRIVVGQWPPAESPAAKAKTDGEVLRIPIYNVRDKARLVQIARDTYEEIGRGEIGGEFSTATLASFGGGNHDPDLLRLRPLEPVEMLIDVSQGPTPIVSDLARQLTGSFDDEVRALTRRIGDVDAARAIVAARRGAVIGVLDAFRVTSVRFTVAADIGVQIDASFQNYIVSRHGQTEDIARENVEPVIKAARADAKGQNRHGGIKKIPAAIRAAARRWSESPSTDAPDDTITEVRDNARRAAIRDAARRKR